MEQLILHGNPDHLIIRLLAVRINYVYQIQVLRHQEMVDFIEDIVYVITQYMYIV